MNDLKHNLKLDLSSGLSEDISKLMISTVPDEINAFEKAFKTAFINNHEGNPIQLSGCAIVYTETDVDLFSASIAVELVPTSRIDLITIKRYYQQHDVPGFRLRYINGINAVMFKENVPVTLKRLQLQYRKNAPAQTK